MIGLFVAAVSILGLVIVVLWHQLLKSRRLVEKLERKLYYRNVMPPNLKNDLRSDLAKVNSRFRKSGFKE